MQAASAPLSRIVLVRGLDPLPSSVQQAMDLSNSVIDPVARLYGYQIPPVDYLRAVVMFPQVSMELDYYFNGFLRILRYGAGQPVVSLPPGTDLRRRGSEDIGVATATCWCVDTLGLKWESVVQIPPSGRRNAKRADFLGECGLGPIVYEAKGTVELRKLAEKLGEGVRQKEETIRVRQPAIALAFVTRVPTHTETVPPFMNVRDPSFERLDVLRVWTRGIQRMLLLERLARYAGLLQTADMAMSEARFMIDMELGRARRYREPESPNAGLNRDRVGATSFEIAQGRVLGRRLSLPDGHWGFVGALEGVLETLSTREAEPTFPQPYQFVSAEQVWRLYPDGSFIALGGSLVHQYGEFLTRRPPNRQKPIPTD